MLSELDQSSFPWRNQIISLERDLTQVPHAELRKSVLPGEGGLPSLT